MLKSLLKELVFAYEYRECVNRMVLTKLANYYDGMVNAYLKCIWYMTGDKPEFYEYSDKTVVKLGNNEYSLDLLKEW